MSCLTYCASTIHNVDNARLKKIQNSPNYRDGKFWNYNHVNMDFSIVKFFSMMDEWMFGEQERSPEFRIPHISPNIKEFQQTNKNDLKVICLGHSSLLINIDGYIVLVDPVFAESVSCFGPSRYNGEVPLRIEDLPAIDVVIISHNHFDHLNLDTIEKLHRKVNRFLVPLAVGAFLEEGGVEKNKIVELDWWETIHAAAGLKITATPAQHFSGRGLNDRNKSLWASWVIIGPEHRIYYSGDGGYSESFKEIGEKYGPFDMTMLENGAYNEMWHPIHMFPEETVQAHLDLKGDILLPVHWGTFNLAFHSWDEPIKRLLSAADSLNVKVTTPMVGDMVDYHQYIPVEKWWEVEQLVQKD